METENIGKVSQEIICFDFKMRSISCLLGAYELNFLSIQCQKTDWINVLTMGCCIFSSKPFSQIMLSPTTPNILSFNLWKKLPYLTQGIIYLRKYCDLFPCILKPQLGYIWIFQESYKLLITTTSCCAYFKICSGQWWKLIILESWDTLQKYNLIFLCLF